MLAQGVHYLHNGYCVIGIKHTASLVLLSYDIALNIFLTFLFVAPLVRSTIRSARLKAIAHKAMAATSIGLVITIVNGFVLYGLGGEELIWTCLGGCAVDLVINAVVMYWAMQSPARTKGSVHVSPLSLTNGARDQPRKDAGENAAVCGTRVKPTVCSFAMPTYEQQEDGLSNRTTVISAVSVPAIDVPQPIIRKPRHVDLYGSHPSGSRLSLSLSAKGVSRSENGEEADISLHELGLARNHDDSGTYELKVRDASSEGN
ncbi:hypothetical protein RSOLAG22IIIB_04347 [Rhizoctonia solani]|uniref:Uncharacterized protein n=1 Tax=Rhizoctonia solani TaxID=456999 RepID=A0A0K6FXP5_9AGAM|nr:hypothetical protein RSOLAG22IIIB_04347 [Rhizoctonia solani]